LNKRQNKRDITNRYHYHLRRLSSRLISSGLKIRSI
jgi:hypothetical protein